MVFKEFVEKIVETLPDYLLQYDIEDIHIDKVHKNNGVVCTGMAVCLKGESISPNIYLEYYYSLFKHSNSLESILELIRDEYNQARERMKMDEYIEMTKENLPDNVFFKLINYDKNKEILMECPHIRFQDLAISFRYLVKRDKEGIASAIIRNSEIEKWEITVEELYNYAYDNTRKLFPPTLKPLNMVMKELMGEVDVSDEVNLNVLTNEQGINGATCMLYEDLIKDFAESYGTDVFILPSSIHEILLLPVCDRIKENELVEMVKEINEYVVSDMDFLSDTVYIYDLKEKRIRI